MTRWPGGLRRQRIRQLDAAEFGDLLPAAFRIFADAMGYPDSYIEPRCRLARTQLQLPEFTAFGSFDRSRLTGFAYGYRAERGQWWTDEVHRALLQAQIERPLAWLDDAFELCEIHVAPDAQGRGIGRGLLHAITGAQPCATILLSTPTGPTRAAALYESEGYDRLASRFRFTSDKRDFEILGKRLRDG